MLTLLVLPNPKVKKTGVRLLSLSTNFKPALEYLLGSRERGVHYAPLLVKTGVKIRVEVG